jgi:TatD DNase family protein
MIFDTHAHYDDEQFDEDREELLSQMAAAGIGTIVNVGAGIHSSQTTLDLAHRYPFIYAAVGVHPDEVGTLTGEDITWLKSVCSDPKVVAVGEIGLDYYWNESDPEIQKRWFIRQLGLAREVKLPVIIHSRDAAQDTLEIMKAHGRDLGGVIHCFSYSVEIAREYLNMDYYLGIGGVLTFKNARKLKEVVEYAPMDRIVLETDCPYLAPVPNRGKRNSSMNLPYVVDAIAEIKDIPAEEVIRITEENAKKMYRMK